MSSFEGDELDWWLSETTADIARFQFRQNIVVGPRKDGGCEVTWMQYFSFPSAPLPLLSKWVGPEYFYLEYLIRESMPGSKTISELQEETRGQSLANHVFAGVGWTTKAIMEDEGIYRAILSDSDVVSNFSSGESASDISRSGNTILPDFTRRMRRLSVSTTSRRNQKLHPDLITRKRVQGISKRIVKNHHVITQDSSRSQDDNSAIEKSSSSSFGKSLSNLKHALKRGIIGSQIQQSGLELPRMEGGMPSPLLEEATESCDVAMNDTKE